MAQNWEANFSLPTGWEAKYDPTSRRYFYIDHINRVTSWEDPRSKGGMLASKPAEAPRSRSGSHSGQKDDKNHSERNRIIKELHEEYPGVMKDIMSDLFRESNYDKYKTRTQLQNLGFKQKVPAPPATSSTHGNRSTSTSQGSRAASPIPNTTTNSHTNRSTPTKKDNTEAKVKQLTAELKQKYPDQPTSIINMALAACDWDKDKCCRLLESMTGPKSPRTDSHDQRSRSATPNKTSRPQSPEDSRSPSPKKTSRSQSPVVTSIFSPGSSTSGEPLFTTIHVGDSSHHRSSGSRGVTVNVPGSTRYHSPSSGHQNKAKNKTKTSKRHPERAPKETIRTGGSGLSNGPDASLRMGPQKDLLADEYEEYNGPNPENRSGPDKEIRLYEKSVAVGPSSEHRTGPNPEFHAGPGEVRLNEQ